MSSDDLRERMTEEVQKNKMFREMETVLERTRGMADRKAEVCQGGSGFGALENRIRRMEGERPVAANLEFGNSQRHPESMGRFPGGRGYFRCRM